MDTSSLLDLISSPINDVSVPGEGSEEEGEDIGDILDDIIAIPVTNVAGEGSEEEEGEDIGDILDELVVTPVGPDIMEGEGSEEEEGEDIGDILEELKATAISLPVTTGEASEEGEDIGDILDNIKPIPLVINRDKEAQTEPEIPTEKISVGDLQKPKEPLFTVSPETIESFSNQFVAKYEGPLSQMQGTLSEFCNTQHQLLRLLELETTKFESLPPELQQAMALFQKAPFYQTKVEAIQREMGVLSEKIKVAKMKSNTLLQKKKQDDREEEVRRAKAQEKEEMLTAKHADNLWVE